MVATIAPFEAMLESRSWTIDDRAFVERAARFLIGRALMRGSSSVHNADERTTATAWSQLAFPRFYFYDVLRGLAALVRWAERTAQLLPIEAISSVVESLVTRWPDGVVHVERHAHALHLTTIMPTADRSPSPRVATTTFPLLEAVSAIGEPSEGLTRQWTATRAGLLRLAASGKLA